MCGGGGTPATTVTTDKVPGYIEDAQKAAINAGKAYASGIGSQQPAETTAYAGMGLNADYLASLMPQQRQLIESLYAGGGMGAGAPYIRNAYQQASGAYSPYLQQGYLDPMTNPYLQPSIEAARSGAYNDVANRFSKAGRSFSGAQAGAYGTAATQAAMPLLLGQYNQNVGAQQNAAQGLLGAATGASAGLDAAQQNVLKAQMAAPGQFDYLNAPENMRLAILDRQRQLAQEAVSAQTGFMGGLPTGRSSTTTSKPANDPFQTLLGGGLGLLGLLM